MIDPAIFDEPAAAAGKRYANMLQHFRAVLLASLLDRPDDQRVKDLLRRTVVRISQDFLADEVMKFAAFGQDLADRARIEAADDLGGKELGEEDDVLIQYVEDLGEAWSTELVLQINRDIEQVMRRWQEFALDYHMRRRKTSAAEARAAATENAKRRTDFNFTDKAGRKSESSTFAEKHTRHYALTFAFEVYAMEAHKLGASHMVIVKEREGDRVDFVAGANPTFAELRDEVFHPYSTATLKAVA